MQILQQSLFVVIFNNGDIKDQRSFPYKFLMISSANSLVFNKVASFMRL